MIMRETSGLANWSKENRGNGRRRSWRAPREKAVKFNAQKLAELQAQNLPTLTAAVVNPTIPEGATPEEIAKSKGLIAELDAYFSAFTPMKEGNLCICCGTPQGASNVVDAFFKAGFTWGLAHGEGFCRKCHYPARACHYVGDWFSLSGMILQYHPAGLSFSDKK